jgi:hypothetical protein
MKTMSAPSMHAAAQPAGAPEDTPAAAEFAGGGRGQKLGELLVRLRDVLGKPNQRAFAPYLKRLTKEFGAEKAAISDLTDDELERLGAMSDEDLRVVAAEVVRELAK